MPTRPSLHVVRSAVMASAVSEPATLETEKRPLPVVTISRAWGLDATTVASRLAERLERTMPGTGQWTVYDRQLVEQVAEEHRLTRAEVAAHDERDEAWFEELFQGLGHSATGMAVVHKIARSIRGIARQGQAIIVGRGGSAILRDMGHVLHVRLVAPEKWRAESYAASQGKTVPQALKIVRTHDAERAHFLKSHFRLDALDPAGYDLTVNIARVTVDLTADLIARLVETKRS